MIDFLRRAAVVLVLAGVFLQGLLGLLPSEKVHTPPYRRPWGVQAVTVRRVGPRLVALRVQLLVA